MNLPLNFNPLKRQKPNIVVVKGAGDLATGTIVRLKKAHFSVIALECKQPTAIRRTVAFSEAVYDGEMEVEGIKAVLVHTPNDAVSLSSIEGVVPVLVDEKAESIKKINPIVVVDAIIAKRNINTKITDAPCVIALGPGFTAGVDAHAVIETSRGHYLGSVITNGSAIPNTGIPGIIGGVGKERVIHSPSEGVFKGICSIGDTVKEGDVIALVGDVEVKASISGTLRGLLRSGLEVPKGFKIADIDPRSVEEYTKSCSDKARAIAGGVLEAILMLTPYTLIPGTC